jgi:hypothetical protein
MRLAGGVLQCTKTRALLLDYQPEEGQLPPIEIGGL